MLAAGWQTLLYNAFKNEMMFNCSVCIMFKKTKYSMVVQYLYRHYVIKYVLSNKLSCGSGRCTWDVAGAILYPVLDGTLLDFPVELRAGKSYIASLMVIQPVTVVGNVLYIHDSKLFALYLPDLFVLCITCKLRMIVILVRIISNSKYNTE